MSREQSAVSRQRSPASSPGIVCMPGTAREAASPAFCPQAGAAPCASPSRRARPPRYQVALGNALRSEVPLHTEGVSSGRSGDSARHWLPALAKYNFASKCVPKCNLGTRRGQLFARLVIGQTTASPLARLYEAGVRTSAGRRPACSRPDCGSKSTQTRSPRSGGLIPRLPARPVSPTPSRDAHSPA